MYVECLFGQWKREFSILNRVRLHMDYIPKVVAVCAMLRNIRIDRGLTQPMRLLGYRDPDEDLGDDENQEPDLEAAGGRDAIVARYFS